MPAYESRVVFVNATLDEDSGQELASRYRFDYIPTSYFIDSGGKVASSHTGPLTEEQMRDRLDELLAK